MSDIQNFYLDTVKGRPSAEAVNGMFCVASLLQRRLEEYFKPFGLSPVKFNTLMLLKHLGRSEGLSQNDICHHLIASPSNITRLIDRLIKDGYAKRDISKVDGRVKIIRITKKGSAILDKVFHGYGEVIQESAYVLKRDEVKSLSQLLLKWFSELEKSREE